MENITDMEKKTLGIIAIVFGGIGLFFSWMPLINNIAFIFAAIGLICAIIGILRNLKSKKTVTIVGLVVCIIAIAIVIYTQSQIAANLPANIPNFNN